MPEYIELDEAIRTATEVCAPMTQFDAVNIATAMENIPTANVVKVVRCRKCRHYDCANKTCMRMSVEPEAYGEGIYVNMQENDFCSHGERKEE